MEMYIVDPYKEQRLFMVELAKICLLLSHLHTIYYSLRNIFVKTAPKLMKKAGSFCNAMDKNINSSLKWLNSSHTPNSRTRVASSKV